MEAKERRELLVRNLQKTGKPISGSQLAEELGVSRQVIVQDIAILRAAGKGILATPQGYILAAIVSGRPKRVFACQHSSEEIETELEIMIKFGGKVLDVVVEHPLYGELRGLLMLASPHDLGDYMDRYYLTKAEPLSALTKGVHLHTVEAEDNMQLTRIGEELQKKGFLVCEV